MLFAPAVFFKPAHAQGTATLAGRVTDERGAGLARAAVQVTNAGTGQSFAIETDGEGRYAFADLAAGTYTLRVERQGFRTSVEENVVLNVAGRVTKNFRLPVGEVSETVTVESTPTLLEPQETAVNTVVDRAFVENLPLNGRSFQSLLELTPGVTLTRSSVTSPGQFSVNGQRTNANYFIVDGVSANAGASAAATASQQAAGTLPGLTVLGGTNSLVSVDALQEFRVLTSGYAPEYGRTPGAQVILQTRSGTNEFTGRLYNFFRNEKLDANDFFFNRAGFPRPPLRQNLFGGVLGGPIFLPRFGEGTPAFYSGRDRTFFFFAYEGLRLREPQPLIDTLVPSIELRSQAAASIQPFVRAFPLPNAPARAGDPAGTARYVTTYSRPASYDSYSLRLDHNFGSRAQVFGRAAHTPSTLQPRVFANQFNTTRSDLTTLTGGLTLTLTPRVTNELRGNFSYSEAGFVFEGIETGGAIISPDSFIFPAGVDRANAAVGVIFGNLTTGQTANLTQGRSIGNTQRQINVVDNLSIVTGAHNLKFGADYRRLAPTGRSRAYSLSYAFDTRNAANIAELAAGRVTNNATNPSRIDVSQFPAAATFYFDNLSLYAQDTWRATPALTVTYGARYELNPAPTASRDDLQPRTLSSTDAGDLLTATLAPQGTPLYETPRGNVAPRFGASYLLSERQGLVVRGGAGLFYDLASGQATRGYGFGFGLSSATRRTVNVTFPIAPDQLLAPVATNLDPPYNGDFYIYDRDIRLPYTWQYNLGVERALGRDQTISVSYVGASGRRLLRTELLQNRAARAANPAQNLLAAPAVIVANPALFAAGSAANFGSRLFITRNASSSDYHSLQAQFQRRLARGVQALVGYTFAKSLDDISDETFVNIPLTRANLRQERAPSNFDVRHAFNAAATYELPAPSENRLLRSLFGGFALDGILRLRSATPVNVIIGNDFFNTGVAASNRPDLAAGVPLFVEDASAPGGRRVNRQAFLIPAELRQGTLGRNALRGFPLRQVDLALRREFGLGERLRLQFRAEMFNLFNTPNFADPVDASGNLTLNRVPFGEATQTLGRGLGAGGTAGGLNPLYQVGGPRSTQFALKLLF